MLGGEVGLGASVFIDVILGIGYDYLVDEYGIRDILTQYYDETLFPEQQQLPQPVPTPPYPIPNGTPPAPQSNPQYTPQPSNGGSVYEKLLL